MEKIKVIKLEYDTKDKVTWKAVVLAYDTKEAIKSIINNVSNFDRLTSTGCYGEVDLITKDVFDDYFATKDTEDTEDVNDIPDIQDIDVPVNETKPVNNDDCVCPVCNKSYKTTRTFIKHIKKYH